MFLCKVFWTTSVTQVKKGGAQRERHGQRLHPPPKLPILPTECSHCTYPGEDLVRHTSCLGVLFLFASGRLRHHLERTHMKSQERNAASPCTDKPHHCDWIRHQQFWAMNHKCPANKYSGTVVIPQHLFYWLSHSVLWRCKQGLLKEHSETVHVIRGWPYQVSESVYFLHKATNREI